MKNEIISEISRKMLPYLDNAQMERLQDVLVHCLWGVQIQASDENIEPQPAETNEDLLNMFISAKRVEGCSLTKRSDWYMGNTILELQYVIENV